MSEKERERERERERGSESERERKGKRERGKKRGEGEGERERGRGEERQLKPDFQTLCDQPLRSQRWACLRYTSAGIIMTLQQHNIDMHEKSCSLPHLVFGKHQSPA